MINQQRNAGMAQNMMQNNEEQNPMMMKPPAPNLMEMQQQIQSGNQILFSFNQFLAEQQMKMIISQQQMRGK